jgi:hypothetical protein
MNEKELILTTAKDILVAAINNKHVSFDTKGGMAGTVKIDDLCDHFLTIVNKVKSAYGSIENL